MDQQPASSQRPAFPAEAVTWLVGAHPHTVAVLRDPDLAAAFGAYGHDVTDVSSSAGGAAATAGPADVETDTTETADTTAADTGPVDASAEQTTDPGATPDAMTSDGTTLPFPDRSVDVVVASGVLPADLAEVARVLRPGGLLTLVCNERDHRIPWARKLDATLAVEGAGDEPATDLVNSSLFGFVSDQSFRYWQQVNHESLEALVRTELADLPAEQREEKVAAALELYADYGRGADGMQLPWVTRCFKATVVESAWAPPHGIDEKRRGSAGGARHDEDGAAPDGDKGKDEDRGKDGGGPQDGSDSDLLLIDFR